MSLEANKAAVKRYFAEALDGGRPEVLDEIMVPGCIAHFPGRDAPANRGAAARSSASSFVTTFPCTSVSRNSRPWNLYVSFV